MKKNPGNKRQAAPSAAFAILLLAFSASSVNPQDRSTLSRKPAELGMGASGQKTGEKSAVAEPKIEEAQDFESEVKLLFRVVTCAGKTPLPPHLDSKVVADHCAWLMPLMKRYREQYLSEAAPFLAGLRPKGVPTTVVYPAGGGDLLSALTTYPDARDIATISLELAGDPRRINILNGEQLAESFATLHESIIGLLTQNDSTSENLKKGQRGDIPGQIAFFLVGLAVHGYEPTHLRYFQLQKDGRLHYLTAAEIRTLEKKIALPRHKDWTPPDFSAAFANSEIWFRGADGIPRVHRHFAVNLADYVLEKSPGLVRYLESKGRVAAMTKASSYILWNDGFSRLRAYLLANMDFMISDSTGIPPGLARAAGFVQETYGNFAGSFLDASKKINDEFRTLWNNQPRRPLPFRYGYPDSAIKYHLLVTRRSKDAP